MIPKQRFGVLHAQAMNLWISICNVMLNRLWHCDNPAHLFPHRVACFAGRAAEQNFERLLCFFHVYFMQHAAYVCTLISFKKCSRGMSACVFRCPPPSPSVCSAHMVAYLEASMDHHATREIWWCMKWNVGAVCVCVYLSLATLINRTSNFLPSYQAHYFCHFN